MLAIRHVEPTHVLEVAEPLAKHPEVCPKDSFGENAKVKTYHSNNQTLSEVELYSLPYLTQRCVADGECSVVLSMLKKITSF